jgi:hypothetical protein
VIYDVKGEGYLKLVLIALSDQFAARAALSCLGMVFDANTNASTKLQSISAALTSCGFEFDLAQLSPQGVYAAGRIPIGIFISPGNGGAGRIETMILGEVADSSVQTCVEAFATCVERSSGRRLDEKGFVQACLGSFNAAHGIAVAFEKQIFNVNHGAYTGVREMVRELTQ